MTSPSSAPQTASSETRSLLAEYRTLLQRYGLPDPPSSSPVSRTNAAIGRRAWRARQIREEIEELAREVRWLESEIDGLDTGRRLLLTEEIERIRTRFKEGWSPFPVLGYRIWSFDESGFIGAWNVKWPEPHLDASCARTVPGDEVPHASGYCGTPACGIYAAKRVVDLCDGFEVDDLETGFAIGLVELRGKVFEHERGYRAASATVVAVAIAAETGDLLLTDDPDEIRSLFAEPSRSSTLEAIGVEADQEAGTSIKDRIVGFMDQRTRRHQWT